MIKLPNRFVPTHVHNRTQDKYEVLSRMIKLRSEVTREWNWGVLYRNAADELYGRTHTNFDEAFTALPLKTNPPNLP